MHLQYRDVSINYGPCGGRRQRIRGPRNTKFRPDYPSPISGLGPVSVAAG